MNHSPEPWHYNEPGMFGGIYDNNHHAVLPEDIANGPRVVACVNAFQGIPTTEVKSLKADKDRISRELGRLISYAATCKLTNQRGWMEEFAQRLNIALAAIGDTDRVRFLVTEFCVETEATRAARKPIGVDKPGLNEVY